MANARFSHIYNANRSVHALLQSTQRQSAMAELLSIRLSWLQGFPGLLKFRDCRSQKRKMGFMEERMTTMAQINRPERHFPFAQR